MHPLRKGLVSERQGARFHAVHWDSTGLTDMNPSEAEQSFAYSINDFGWIAGSTTSGTACLLIPYKTCKEAKHHRDSCKH